jgi:hypothetical protein
MAIVFQAPELECPDCGQKMKYRGEGPSRYICQNPTCAVIECVVTMISKNHVKIIRVKRAAKYGG